MRFCLKCALACIATLTICDEGEGTLCSLVCGRESEVPGALGLEGILDQLVTSEAFRVFLREVLERCYAYFKVQSLYDQIHIVAARGP